MKSVGMKIPCYCPLTSMQGDWYSTGPDGDFFFSYCWVCFFL